MHTSDKIVIKVNKLTLFVRFSLDLLGELEDTEWRDTVQLYQEKVRGVQTVCFYRWMCSGIFFPRLKVTLMCFRKPCYATTCSKDCATSGWTEKEHSVVLGTETGNPETHDISLNVEQLDSCCIFKYNLFLCIDSQLFLPVNLFFINHNVWNRLSWSAVSSMRTGPARTCMASKRAWVTWSRAWG